MLIVLVGGKKEVQIVTVSSLEVLYNMIHRYLFLAQHKISPDSTNLLQLCPNLCDLWTVACCVLLSMEFSRQEVWSGLPCPPPGDLHISGTEPTSLMSPALPNGFFTPDATLEHSICLHIKVEFKSSIFPKARKTMETFP